ncbi:hypothetical protein [Xanthomonas sp. 3075]|uniref:hypothetical protein n=1 Tax=Xanthomonas sp. 3075 TaxID=3035315 RepID=UPI001616AB6D|nr:hypothetical protein [Xanthomonas sp. 3075]MBB4130653.1 hypothetical protein [Xanthomonas sp. 3075]
MQNTGTQRHAVTDAAATTRQNKHRTHWLHNAAPMRCTSAVKNRQLRKRSDEVKEANRAGC